MIVSNPSVLIPSAPTIDVSEARWACEEVAALIDRLGPDSPAAMVLRNARRELASLAQSGTATVVGPFRAAA